MECHVSGGKVGAVPRLVADPMSEDERQEMLRTPSEARADLKELALRLRRGKDPAAPRRLYYVAMTRARQTLTLARFDGSRGFPHEWLGHAATIRREAAELPPCSAAVEYR